MVARIDFPYKNHGTDKVLTVYVSPFLTEYHACMFAERFMQLMCDKGIAGILTGVDDAVHAGVILLSAHSTPEETYNSIKELLQGELDDR